MPQWVIYPRMGRDAEGGAAVVLHPRRAAWAAVNSTGREIAEEVARGGTVEDAAGALSLKYGIGREQAREDVRSVIEALAKAGLSSGSGAGDLARAAPPGSGSLFLQLTHRCNLRCSHCYLDCSPDESRPEMPAPDAIDLLARWRAYSGGGVTLSGGEPLAHPGFWDVLAEAARGGEVSVLTNGTLVDDAAARALAGSGAAVQVSLDGPDAESHDAVRGSGAFDGAVRGVRNLRRHLPADRLALCCTVTSGSLPRVGEVRDLAGSLGAGRVRLLPLRRSGHALDRWGDIGEGVTDAALEEMYAGVLDRPRRKGGDCDATCGLTGLVLQPGRPGSDGLWCPAALKAVVDARGDAYPCTLLLHGEFRAGNVLRRPLAEVLGAGWRDRVRSRLARRVGAGPSCRVCDWRGLCQGGCMGVALDRAGDPASDAPAPHCALRKRLYGRAFDRVLEKFAAGRETA